MSVLFVMPPGGVVPSFTEHLGIAFLRTMLARSGIGSEQYLPERNIALPAFASFLAERRPQVVGFTAYESNLRGCRAMARVVRTCLPGTVVLVGGPNATFSPEETLELLGADVCLRGAGEGTIVGIVRAVLGADGARRRLPGLLEPFENLVIQVAGGVHRTRTGSFSSFPGEHFACLDDIPSPYQDGMLATGDVGLLTARGCNQHCTYCSFAAISGRRVHYHGVERVLDDLAAYKALIDRLERKPQSISIRDDAFTLAPQRARIICEGIIRRGLQLPFDCTTRADRVDAELLRLMRRAGFVTVSFGLESAVPRVLRTIGKVQDPATRSDPGFEGERRWLEDFRSAVAAAKEAGLLPMVSVIGGLPGETAGDLLTTLAFVDSLRVTTYAHNVLALLPGTPLHEGGERHGLSAGREPVTGRWLTRHAYDVHAVKPLPSSQLRGERWDEADLLTAGLCGRPRPELAAEGAAWAVVLHECRPDPAVAEWLLDVLAIQGVVLVIETERALGAEDWRRWARLFTGAGLPLGLLALLSPEAGPPGRLVLRSIGTLGEHRFELATSWDSSGTGVGVEEAGNCSIPVWLASDPSSRPPLAVPATLFDPSPQIAHGCRWWPGRGSCGAPRVLHVRADGSVGPCWHGPAIGRVGETWAVLAARGQALVAGAAGAPATGRCPLGRPAGTDPVVEAATEGFEVASHLGWWIGREVERRRTERTPERERT